MKARLFPAAFVAATFALLAGCSNGASSLAPTTESGAARLLNRPATLAKPAEGEGLGTSATQRIVVPNASATLKTGNATVGFNTLEFPQGAVSERVFVEMRMQLAGTVLTEVEFSPHGIEFNVPVVLTLSYEGADLGGIDESKLAIFYYNEATGGWEVIENFSVDTERNIIRGYLDHFSQYAVGSVD